MQVIPLHRSISGKLRHACSGVNVRSGVHRSAPRGAYFADRYCVSTYCCRSELNLRLSILCILRLCDHAHLSGDVVVTGTYSPTKDGLVSVRGE